MSLVYNLFKSYLGQKSLTYTRKNTVLIFFIHLRVYLYLDYNNVSYTFNNIYIYTCTIFPNSLCAEDTAALCKALLVTKFCLWCNRYVNFRDNNLLQYLQFLDSALVNMSTMLYFFLQNIATVGELEGITKELPGLVEVRNVGAWIVHRCINCSTNTHSIHRERGAALVLINANILVSYSRYLKWSKFFN